MANLPTLNNTENITNFQTFTINTVNDNTFQFKNNEESHLDIDLSKIYSILERIAITLNSNSLLSDTKYKKIFPLNTTYERIKIKTESDNLKKSEPPVKNDRQQSLLNLTPAKILKATASDIKDRALDRFKENSFVKFGMNVNNAIKAFKGNYQKPVDDSRKELTQEQLQDKRSDDNNKKQVLENLIEIKGYLKKILDISDDSESSKKRGGLLSSLSDFFSFKGLKQFLPGILSGASAGAIAGSLGSLGLGALVVGSIAKSIYDGFDGWTKSQEWGVGAINGTISGFLGGNGEGLGNAILNAIKGAGLGTGVMMAGASFGVVGGPPGILMGALVGAAMGALFGYIGGENLAKTFAAMGDWISDQWTKLIKMMFGKTEEEVVSSLTRSLPKESPLRTELESNADAIRQKKLKLKELREQRLQRESEINQFNDPDDVLYVAPGYFITEPSEKEIELQEDIDNEREKQKRLIDEAKEELSKEKQSPAQRRYETQKENEKSLLEEKRRLEEIRENLYSSDDTLIKLQEELDDSTSLFSGLFGSDRQDERVQDLEKRIEERKQVLSIEENKLTNSINGINTVLEEIQNDLLKIAFQNRLNTPSIQPIEEIGKTFLRAVNPNVVDTKYGPETESTYMSNKLFADTMNLLAKEEDIKLNAYIERDDSGNIIYQDKEKTIPKFAIGYGSGQIIDKVTGEPRAVRSGDTITKEEALYLKDQMVRNIAIELLNSNVGRIFDKVKDPAKKTVLLSTAYQLGVPRFIGFTDTWEAIDIANQTETQEAWNNVAKHILNSKWAIQTTDRANRVANVLRQVTPSGGEEEPESAATGMIVKEPKTINVGDYKGVENNPEVVIPMRDLENRVIRTVQKVNDMHRNEFENNDMKGLSAERRIASIVKTTVEMEKRINTNEQLNGRGKSNVSVPLVHNVVDNSNIVNTNQSFLVKQSVSNQHNPFLMLT